MSCECLPTLSARMAACCSTSRSKGLVYGESSIKVKDGHFNEDSKYTAEEIRFTTKGATLCAIALGWPADNKLVVKSLAESAGKISGVSLLGYDGKLDWKQAADSLVVTLPKVKLSQYACALKITGADLKPAAVEVK